ncbi:MAG: carbon storage regulator CsrA [Candidatus Adiutricales bacterium]
MTRKSGESLIIGDEVTVTVVEVRGNQVKIGIDAPESVKVYREELLRKIVSENIEASKSDKEKLAILANKFKKKK